ncbi:alpha/beta hydrolase family protein [Dactylosporangium sp. McL0621]|uniref:alpha/beta hydrolase family protein n=1 Tax=Dactylosporangium sp. McL0621 TaxID=3415678 RepID=UPI003CE68FBF
MPERNTVVDTAMGPLNAILCTPDGPARAGLVLSDGSGPATRDAWQGVPGWLAERGIATLRHDKPGCGGSPGDWRAQSLGDRAIEGLAALDALRKQATVDRAGLIGYSQGGWVAIAAAANEPGLVDFVVTVSGPMVGPIEQERVRIERALRARGRSEEVIADALRWVDERADRLVAGQDPAQILADQARYARRDWYAEAAGPPYDTEELLVLGGRLARFDPAEILPFVRCPVMAFFGAADELVPVERSLVVLGERLPAEQRGNNGVAVLPGVGHMLYPEPPQADVPLFQQLSPAFLPLLEAFLDRVAAG